MYARTHARSAYRLGFISSHTHTKYNALSELIKYTQRVRVAIVEFGSRARACNAGLAWRLYTNSMRVTDNTSGPFCVIVSCAVCPADSTPPPDAAQRGASLRFGFVARPDNAGALIAFQCPRPIRDGQRTCTCARTCQRSRLKRRPASRCRATAAYMQWFYYYTSFLLLYV